MFVGEAAIAPNRRVYAIGDIHGCITELKSLFADIQTDLKAYPVGEHVIIALAAYVDRGPDSRAVLDFLIEKKQTDPMICLCGNHDQRMLEFLDIPEQVGDSFLRFGGQQMLESYGLEIGGDRDIASLARELKAVVPSSHLRFLNSLALSHSEGDYFFVHAGVKPGIPLDRQEPGDMLWIRNEFLIHQGSFDAVVVHGHTPGDFVDIRPNRINLDTYCFDSGVLSCAVLEGTEIRLLQTQARRR